MDICDGLGMKPVLPYKGSGRDPAADRPQRDVVEASRGQVRECDPPLGILGCFLDQGQVGVTQAESVGVEEGSGQGGRAVPQGQTIRDVQLIDDCDLRGD